MCSPNSKKVGRNAIGVSRDTDVTNFELRHLKLLILTFFVSITILSFIKIVSKNEILDFFEQLKDISSIRCLKWQNKQAMLSLQEITEF